MATKNPRLNVVLEEGLYSGISKLAKKRGLSMSLLARDLIKEALELHEDRYLYEKALKRDKTFKKSTALTHDEVWGH